MGNIDFSRTALSKTAATFIATFLRFEFALKEAGFGPRNGAALVEWGRVANELGPDFLKAVGASGRATTILQKPPKKQITREHSLEWDDAKACSSVHDLVLALQRVRNNLLHGGKSGDPDSKSADPARNETLIAEAQWVVEQALWRMDDVRMHFEGNY